MRFLLKLWILYFCFLTAANAEQKRDVYASLVDSVMLAYMKANHIPGAAVQLIINGVPHTYYYGYANTNEKTPVTEKTIFEVGSLTKIVTSLLISQEVDFNNMQLTDPVKKYWNDLPDAFDKVTIKQLATHTGGLPFNTPPTILSENELLAYFNKKAPMPKNEWQYSNVGVGLLGFLLEKMSERPYDRIYRTHVSWPLGMQAISTHVPESLMPFYAQGYDPKNKPVAPIENEVFPAASALKMAAGDMQNFLSAAIGLPGTPERILYPMRMTQSVYVKLPNRYQGLAWDIHPLNSKNITSLVTVATNFGKENVNQVFERPLYFGNALFDKTGGTKGFKSYIAVVPNKQSGIAIMVNKNTNSNDLVKIARQMLFRFAKIDATDYNKAPIVDEA